jgi:hypothetical protein
MSSAAVSTHRWAPGASIHAQNSATVGHLDAACAGQYARSAAGAAAARPKKKSTARAPPGATAPRGAGGVPPLHRYADESRTHSRDDAPLPAGMRAPKPFTEPAPYTPVRAPTRPYVATNAPMPTPKPLTAPRPTPKPHAATKAPMPAIRPLVASVATPKPHAATKAPMSPLVPYTPSTAAYSATKARTYLKCGGGKPRQQAGGEWDIPPELEYEMPPMPPLVPCEMPPMPPLVPCEEPADDMPEFVPYASTKCSGAPVRMPEFVPYASTDCSGAPARPREFDIGKLISDASNPGRPVNDAQIAAEHRYRGK